MKHTSRRIAGAVGLVLLVVLILLGLRQFAAALTAQHMANRAASEQALLGSNQPLWRWTLHRPDDLVAGRAFGHASVARVREGLRLTSIDGSPFELGLPIARGLDLAHWPYLELELATAARGRLDVIWQAATGPACIARAATLPGRRLRIDLRRLDWHAAGVGRCDLPGSARMLRLRITLPAGAEVTVSSARLEAAKPIVPANQGNPGPLVPGHLADLLKALSEPAAAAAPRLQIPAGASAEQMLEWRDRIKAVRPAALVVPGSVRLQEPFTAAAPAWLGWLAALGYAAALALVALRRPGGRAGTAIEVVACMLGPLWLMVGLQWGLHPAIPGALAFTCALVFGALIQWRDPSPSWHWIGNIASVAAWLPMVTLPLAALVCVIWGHAFEHIVGRRALVYLGWALLQQWLVLGVVLPRLERLMPGVLPPVLLVALLFALMHTPNGALMQLCFVAELWWAWCFTRSRSLLPVAVAHATSALVVGAALIGGVLRSLEVSARFFL